MPDEDSGGASAPIPASDQPSQALDDVGVRVDPLLGGGRWIHALAVDERGDLVLLLDRQLEVLEEGERGRVLLLQPGEAALYSTSCG